MNSSTPNSKSQRISLCQESYDLLTTADVTYNVINTFYTPNYRKVFIVFNGATQYLFHRGHMYDNRD